MKSNKKKPLATRNISDRSDKMPFAVFYIISGKMAERFSIAGIACTLIIFISQYLFDNHGNHEFTATEAVIWYHNFFAAIAIFSFAGAIISDAFLGKYKTIVIFSVIYFFGHVVLAFFNNRVGLTYGLTLIAIGCGGSLPCFAAHLGDQFNKDNKQHITKSYSWFYLGVTIGTFLAMFLVPYLLQKYGPRVAFATTSISMFIALILFCLGGKEFTIIQPIGWNKYLAEFKDRDNLKAIGNLVIIFIFAVFLYAAQAQSNTSWVIQASHMDCEIDLGFLKFTLIQSQVQAFQYVFFSIFIPLFSYIVYPFVGKFVKITYLKKIAVGFLFAGFSYVILTYAQSLIEEGKRVGIIWQISAYALMAIEEILVVITCIELAYAHSPRSMKSMAIALFFLSTSLGDEIVIMINKYFQNAHIQMSFYFGCFAVGMFVVGLVFAFYIPHYKGKVFLQLSSIGDILDIILIAAKKRIAMVTLSGSFSKKNILQDIVTVRNLKYQHNDNYHFTIITKERVNEGLKEIKAINNFVNNEFRKQGLTSVTSKSHNNNVTFTYKSIFTLKSEIVQNPQLLNFSKESIPIYTSSNFKLIELTKSIKDRLKYIIEIGHDHFFKDGIDFLYFATSCKDEANNAGLIVFQLHQSIESFYNSVLLLLNCYRPKTHDLGELHSIICTKTNKLDNVFSTSIKERKEYFVLLENGYFSRYNANYKVSLCQIDYLINNVKKLQKIIKELYEQEIEVLQEKIDNFTK